MVLLASCKSSHFGESASVLDSKEQQGQGKTKQETGVNILSNTAPEVEECLVGRIGYLYEVSEVGLLRSVRRRERIASWGFFLGGCSKAIALSELRLGVMNKR